MKGVSCLQYGQYTRKELLKTDGGKQRDRLLFAQYLNSCCSGT